MFTYSVADAASPFDGRAPDDTRSARECPSLFGDDEDMVRNRKHRVALLEQLYQGPFTIWLVHRGDWVTPQRVNLRGVELIETAPHAEAPAAAIVSIDEQVAGACGEGLYAIEVDDQLGPQIRVVGVTPDVLLLEHEDRLVYLTTDDTVTPVWRLVWHPRWKFHQAPNRAAAPPTPPHGRR